MSERSRPPGLDKLAKDGLKLAGRLAIGLASLPLIGLALAGSAGRERRRGSGEAPGPEAPRPDPGPPLEEAAGQPGRAEIETALEKLAEASIARGGPAQAKVRSRARVKPRKSSPRRAPATPRPDRDHPDAPR
ncbi:hypothetical protein [Enterovirga aerilata]|uniref:Uncharacterized protein n=1 Tax=Enterovirga aerilata TaxID=2730920 RepID=A0A849HWK2_9HYPH|nr:hypothetical protein [Enterovirga sp. DB1703]NNM71482.1 hypothetical protein [Enterovirga sp. DB1703]